jgi:hypothetical protein
MTGVLCGVRALVREPCPFSHSTLVHGHCTGTDRLVPERKRDTAIILIVDNQAWIVLKVTPSTTH